jgi:hypothetical protein
MNDFLDPDTNFIETPLDPETNKPLPLGKLIPTTFIEKNLKVSKNKMRNRTIQAILLFVLAISSTILFNLFSMLPIFIPICTFLLIGALTIIVVRSYNVWDIKYTMMSLLLYEIKKEKNNT